MFIVMHVQQETIYLKILCHSVAAVQALVFPSGNTNLEMKKKKTL